MRVRFAARTHRGAVREHNEDNFLIDPKLRLFIVADGMGGHRAGEVASAMSVNLFRKLIRRHRDVVEACQAQDNAENRKKLRKLLDDAVLATNHLVLQHSSSHPWLAGMGTTFTGLILAGHHGFLAHVGDSRAYLVREGAANQITQDHTLLNALRSEGKIKALHELRAQFRNAVTRAVGVEPHLEVDVADFEVLPGDRFLLCSDGLYEYLDGDDLAAHIESRKDQSCDELVQSMLDLAVQSGGSDNITALWVEAEPAEDEEALAQGRRRERIRFLADLPLFDGLDDDEIAAVESKMHEWEVRRGDVLDKPGGNTPQVCVLLVGRLGVFLRDEHVDSLRPGTVYGVASMVSRRPSRDEVRALTDCRVLAISNGDMHELLAAPDSLAQRLTWNLARMLGEELVVVRGSLHSLRVQMAQREPSRPRVRLERLRAEDKGRDERPTSLADVPPSELDRWLNEAVPPERGEGDAESPEGPTED